MKINLKVGYDFVSGYIWEINRCGIVNIPDEDIQLFRENPSKYINDNEIDCELDTKIVDFDITDVGNINQVTYEEINEVEK